MNIYIVNFKLANLNKYYYPQHYIHYVYDIIVLLQLLMLMYDIKLLAIN